MSVPSYPKVLHVRHRQCRDLFKGPVIIEEKIDGSQVSFMLDSEGNPQFRSKGVQQNIHAPDRLFAKAAEVIRSLDLIPGYVYRGEYLSKPKHNILSYHRVPRNHIVLYDIMVGEDSQAYAPTTVVAAEAERLGLEHVRTLYMGDPPTTTQIVEEYIHLDSQLGGCTVEGVVVKALNRDLFARDGKPVVAKIVGEKFAEVARSKGHKVKFASNKHTHIVGRLADQLTTEARWNKAVIHLRERDLLVDAPQDIGKLIPEVVRDTLEEEADWIKEQLFKDAWKTISRRITRGLPEWYKAKLMEEPPELTEATVGRATFRKETSCP